MTKEKATKARRARDTSSFYRVRADGPVGLSLDQLISELGNPSETLASAGIDPLVLQTGLRLQRARIERGITQSELAARVGITQPQLSDIEAGKGRKGPAHAIVRRIEIELGLDEGLREPLCTQIKIHWHGRQGKWSKAAWHEALPPTAQVAEQEGFIRSLLDAGLWQYISEFIKKRENRVETSKADMPPLLLSIPAWESIDLPVDAPTVFFTPRGVIDRLVIAATPDDHVEILGDGAMALVNRSGCVNVQNTGSAPQLMVALPTARLPA